MRNAYQRARRAATENGLLTYDEPDLAAALRALSGPALVAFAAACASRLVTTAVTQGAEMSLALQAIEELRNFTTGSTLREADALEAQLIASIPDENEAPGFEASVVEDALAAAAYGLRCALHADVMDAVYASQRAYDAADRCAGLRQNETEFTETVEITIMSHPSVQSELQRQRRDLDDLGRMQRDLDPSAFATLIDRAKQEPMLN